ncbi:Non-reducing polyketide synthase mapC [Lachnellula suecica]|uniref:Non-reducing polyketide synthase mapC n=1 Tax=Lachnellula suecica TaxID=602035 RepID=A0A8T9BZ58_9HELO|nr:Non-reducing polyketide synthase mapC [Lachnellula suecica]
MDIWDVLGYAVSIASKFCNHFERYPVMKDYGTVPADELDLKLDIYTRDSWSQTKIWDEDQPVMVFFHGGGYVGYDREHVPPHIVQSCLTRGWPLVSPDYRKLPQVKGEDILSDAKAAYDFVVERLLGLLTSGASKLPMKNVIVAGASAGGNLAILCAHHIEPRPVALLDYYAPTTVQDDFFSSSKVLGPVSLEPSDVERFLREPVSLGITPPSAAFNLESLTSDLSRNPKFQPLERELYPRMVLFPWLVQQNLFQDLMGSVDKGIDNASWASFPPTVIVHGSVDMTVPIAASEKLVKATDATLFVVHGQGHAFDEPLFLGDLGLYEVEKAWKALENVVKVHQAR